MWEVLQQLQLQPRNDNNRNQAAAGGVGGGGGPPGELATPGSQLHANFAGDKLTNCPCQRVGGCP